MAVATLTRQQAWRGNASVLVWVTFHWADSLGNPVSYLWSGEYIPDPSTYAGGPKTARVLKWDKNERQLTDRKGRVETSTLTITLSDTDSLIRGFFTNAFQRNAFGMEVSVDWRTGPDRLAGNTPAASFHGLVKSYTSIAGRSFSFTAWDLISALQVSPVPQRLIGAYFPDADSSIAANPIVRWYGRLSDEPASSTGAPVPVAESGSGATAPGFVNQSPYNPADQLYGVLPLNAAMAGFDPQTALAPSPGASGAPAAPTALAVTWSAASGGSPGNWWGNNLNGEGKFRFQARSYSAAGVPSDPTPFLSDDVAGASGPSGVNVQPTITFTPSVGAVNTDVCSGQLCAGSDLLAQQIANDGGTASVFLNQTPHAAPPPIDPATIAAGAVLPTFAGSQGALFCWVVTAVLSSGETAASTPWFSRFSGWLRRYRLCFSSVAGALQYFAYRATVTVDPTTGVLTIGTFSRRWNIATTALNGAGNLVFVDDMMDAGVTMVTGVGSGTTGAVVSSVTQGTVPLIPVGGPWTDLTGHAWALGMILSEGAIKGNVTVYSRDSSGTITPLAAYDDTQCSVPGRTGFTTRWGPTYRTMSDGYTVTLAYFDGALAASIVAGTLTIYANFDGVETVGDGTGTRIDQPVLQMAHLLDNDLLPLALGIAGWKGGKWATSPPNFLDGRPARDLTSFSDAATAMTSILGTDLGAWGVPNGAGAQDLLASLAVDAEVAHGPNAAGALIVIVENPDPTATPDTAAALSFQTEIKALSLTWLDQTTADYLYNQVVYQYAPAFDSSGNPTNYQQLTANNLPGQTAYRGRVIQASETLTFLTRRDHASAVTIVNRLLARAVPPPRDTKLTTHLFALSQLDLGSQIPVTDPDGAGPSGFIGQILQVRTISTLWDTGEVQLTLRDLNATEDTAMLAAATWPFGGDNNNVLANTSYVSGGALADVLPGTNIWEVDAVQLPGTYCFEVSANVQSGVTLKVGFFNLDTAPNLPIVEVTLTSSTTFPIESEAITFAAPGTVYRYGIKAYVSAPGAQVFGVVARRLS